VRGCRAYCAGSACTVQAMCGGFAGQGVTLQTSASFQISIAKAAAYTACYEFGGDVGSSVVSKLSAFVVTSASGTTITPQSFSAGVSTTITVNGKGLRASDRLLLVSGSDCLAHGKYPTQANLAPSRALSSTGGMENKFLMTVPKGQNGAWSACYSYGKKGDFSSKIATLNIVTPAVSSFKIGGGNVTLEQLPVGQRTTLIIVGSGLTYKDRIAIVERNAGKNQPCSADQPGSGWIAHISGIASFDTVKNTRFEVNVDRSSEFAVCYDFGGVGSYTKEIGTLISK